MRFMSIMIDKEKCVGCKMCKSVCPGNLIKIGEDSKAYIKYPDECWGCVSCVKECRFKAIKFFLGADIGGRGSLMYTESDKDVISWIVDGFDGKKTQIDVIRKNSNQY